MPAGSKQTKGRRRVAGQVDYVALSRDLVDAVESGVYIVQSKKFVYVNPFFARLTGYSPDELIGIRSFKLVLPQDRPAVRKKATRNLKSRHASSPYEYRFIKKNGETIWVMERVSPIEYMGQKAALGSFVDITPRKRLEEALAHSEETYRTMLEQMYDSYYEVDLAGNFTFVNDSVCRNLGYASEEMVGQSYRFSTPPGDVAANATETDCLSPLVFLRCNRRLITVYAAVLPCYLVNKTLVGFARSIYLIKCSKYGFNVLIGSYQAVIISHQFFPGISQVAAKRITDEGEISRQATLLKMHLNPFLLP